jgi:hypothetical protein
VFHNRETEEELVELRGLLLGFLPPFSTWLSGMAFFMLKSGKGRGESNPDMVFVGRAVFVLVWRKLRAI